MRIWKGNMGFKWLIPILVCLVGTSPFSQAVEKNRAVLVRSMKKDSARPVDLSSDGRYILTIGERKNPERSGARLSVLAVYETEKGNNVGKPVIEAEGSFITAIFDDSRRVLALKMQLTKPRPSYALLEWDFVSERLGERPVQLAFTPQCILNNRQFAGIVPDRNTPKGRVPQELLTVSEENSLRILRQPSAIPSDYPYPRFHSPSALLGDNCSAWRWKDNILLANTSPGDLHWISFQPDKDPIRCHSFPGEIICGHAVSPDGSLIAVVTIDRDLDKLTRVAEVPPVFLNLLRAETCKPMGRTLLHFPEKPAWRRSAPLSRKKSIDNGLFLHQLASRIAISPDNKKLALAYGIFKSSDGDAYFGLYSLSDGRRLATLRGSKNRGGLLQGLRSEEIWAPSAPISGMLRFSPDSRMLYAGSKGVFQWDISGIK